jgi:hypothetical protein
MAARQRTTSYRTYGSVAYAPAYEGNVVRTPQRQEVQRPVPKARPDRKPAARPQVEVRQAGVVSPFAVIGFMAVGVFAVLLLLTYVQLHASSDSVVSLRSQVTQLEADYAALSAQYEQVFDMEHLQAAVGVTMIRPSKEQITYLDLSQPDSVILHAQSPKTGGVSGLVQGAQEIFYSLVEYFR